MAATLADAKVGQIHISVTDIDRSVAFYRDTLGLPFLFQVPGQPMAFFDCGGTRLYLSAENEQPGSESVLYFRVADISAAHANLTARGVEFHGAPHMIHRHADGTEEWMAFFKDPEGRPLALMSQAKP